MLRAPSLHVNEVWRKRFRKLERPAATETLVAFFFELKHVREVVGTRESEGTEGFRSHSLVGDGHATSVRYGFSHFWARDHVAGNTNGFTNHAWVLKDCCSALSYVLSRNDWKHSVLLQWQSKLEVSVTVLLGAQTKVDEVFVIKRCEKECRWNPKFLEVVVGEALSVEMWHCLQIRKMIQ